MPIVLEEDDTDLQDLTIAVSSEDGVRVVRAVGELDASTAALLRAAVDDGFNDGASSVVLDLEGVSFIDSSGLSVLIHAYKEAKDRDGELTLRAPSAAVVRLLDMTGQTERFLTPGE